MYIINVECGRLLSPYNIINSITQCLARIWLRFEMLYNLVMCTATPLRIFAMFKIKLNVKGCVCVCVNEHVITLYVYGTADEPFLILYATVLYSYVICFRNRLLNIFLFYKISFSPFELPCVTNAVRYQVSHFPYEWLLTYVYSDNLTHIH